MKRRKVQVASTRAVAIRTRPLRLLSHALLVIVLLAACTAIPGPGPAPDLSGWAVLYQRAGWQGGATQDLRFTGDMMLGRYVAQAAERHGLAYPFAHTARLLDGDLSIGNLESPLTSQREQLRPGPYRLPAPPEFASALQQAGFTALGLANNHALDAGSAGLSETLELLDGVGIGVAGAGETAAAAYQPLLLEAGQLQLALLAFNDIADPADPAATGNPDFAGCTAGEACRSGRAWLDETALQAVQAARDSADFVIVMLHWGAEYQTQPSARQQLWAKQLIAAGADLLVGAHPHVLQPATMLSAGTHSGFVAYSLGDFIFDAADDPNLSSGAVLRVLIDEQGIALVAAAVLRTAAGQPQALELQSSAAEQALQILRGEVVNSAASTSTTTPAQAGSIVSAWRWENTGATPVAVDPGLRLPAPPARISADLRGNGEPLHASLNQQGLVELYERDGQTVLWRNEDPSWQITRMVAGDPNDDGRSEILLLLWKPDSQGVLRSHPFLLGWRAGQFRIIWGGSATSIAVQDLALADLDRDGRSELITLEGGSRPGEPAETVAVWHWHGWGFQLEWRSAAGTFSQLGLVDLDGDQQLEIVAIAERLSRRAGWNAITDRLPPEPECGVKCNATSPALATVTIPSAVPPPRQTFPT